MADQESTATLKPTKTMTVAHDKEVKIRLDNYILHLKENVMPDMDSYTEKTLRANYKPIAVKNMLEGVSEFN